MSRYDLDKISSLCRIVDFKNLDTDKLINKSYRLVDEKEDKNLEEFKDLHTE